MTRIETATKRAFDIMVAAGLLVLTAPVMAVVVALVAIRLGRPVLFRQLRPGLQGRTFTLYKFRSLTEDRDARGELLPDEQRLTPFGRWLRASSLDELPSFWNVLRGDMSLVGPRPLLVEYLDYYSEREARRHDVRPGITGWAQVNGRNAISWAERLEMDVWYVENRSLALDLRILWRTAIRVVRREGITPHDRETMPRFRGNRDGALGTGSEH